MSVTKVGTLFPMNAAVRLMHSPQIRKLPCFFLDGFVLEEGDEVDCDYPGEGDGTEDVAAGAGCVNGGNVIVH